MNEATTKGSIARNIVAELVRRERRALRQWNEALSDSGNNAFGEYLKTYAESKYIEALYASETARRILYGLEL